MDREFVEAAAVRAEIARSKYHNGLLSFEDWDIIEAEYSQPAEGRAHQKLAETASPPRAAQGSRRRARGPDSVRLNGTTQARKRAKCVPPPPLMGEGEESVITVCSYRPLSPPLSRRRRM